MTCHNHQTCGPIKTLITTLFTFLFQAFTPTYSAIPTVAISQIVNHPALNHQRDGIIAAIKKAGYSPGVDINIVTEDAQGNVGIATQIATKFASLSPTVAVGISTPSAQTLVMPMQKIGTPIIYTAVTDPKAAKLASSPDQITGVSCNVPVKVQLELMQKVLSDLKVIGVVHNPGETNSAATLKVILMEAEALGITVVVAPATKTSEVKSATDSLMGQVQAILLADDNTVASAIEAVIAVTKEAKVPVFASDLDLIQKGALCGRAVDHFELGKQAGLQVIRLVRGEKISDIPAESPNDISLWGNKNTADALGVKLPDDVKWVDEMKTPNT